MATEASQYLAITTYFDSGDAQRLSAWPVGALIEAGASVLHEHRAIDHQIVYCLIV